MSQSEIGLKDTTLGGGGWKTRDTNKIQFSRDEGRKHERHGKSIKDLERNSHTAPKGKRVED